MNRPFHAGERLVPQNRTPPARLQAPGPAPDGRRARPPARRRWLTWLGRLAGLFAGLMVLGVVAGAVAVYGAYRHYAAGLPDLEGLKNYQPKVVSRVYAGNGQLVSELAAERRILVRYANIPPVVRKAFLAAEDQNFWTHKGVDPLAILRAAVSDLHHIGEGRRPMGASTITQQVAKNMLLGNEVSLARKVKEAILAMRIEQSLSKERILELYLNEIYLGQGAYGVAAAAQAYFNKPLDQITLPEAASLAALPKAPNNYNLFRNPDAARTRRDWVLDRMAEDRAITLAQAADAKAQPLLPAAYRRPETVTGGEYFGEEVRRRLVERFGNETTTTGGLQVRTTLDPLLQKAADKALHDGLIAYDRAHGGWRGAVARVDGPVRTSWVRELGRIGATAGLLPSWRQGIVLEVSENEARVGWLERSDQPQAPPEPHIAPTLLAETGWARPDRNGRLGPAPRRMADVVRVGDVVPVEPIPAGPVNGRGASRPERVLLRQIPVVQGALVSMDPRTGRVLSMVGGWSFELSQFNRATQAMRQPGSSFKPFVFLTAMEQGISPSQRFSDGPFVQDLGAAGKWQPMNYEMDFGGPVALHTALVKSLNLVTVRVAERVGMEAVAQTAIGFHVVDNMPRVLPAALGAVDTTVLRMAAAYSGLDQGGREVIPRLIDSVQDRDGRLLWRPDAVACDACRDPDHPPQIEDHRPQVADSDSVFQVVTMMQDVVAHGTGMPAGAGLGRPIAGKTGTTQDFKDAWFGGFTPDLVTIVWVGFDTPDSLGDNETGGALAAPIWHDYMAVALKNRPVLTFTPPPGVTMAKWGGVTDAFKPGQVPGVSEGATATAQEGGGGSPAGLDTTMGGLY